MNRRLIRKVDCIETRDGVLLYWDIMDGVTIRNTIVYGIDNRTRQYSILSPLISTGRCLVDLKNYPLLKAFKLRVIDIDGCSDESDDIIPQRLEKGERLLLTNIKDRMRTWMKATPIGSYPCTLLLRRLDGEPCDTCGYGICAIAGGEIPADSCPICLGTGIKDPYFKYPKLEWMHGETPIEDVDNKQLAGLNRSMKTRVFRSVCDIHLREGDVIVTGGEVYQIVKHEVKASVGNAPADYLLTCIKYAPADQRYSIFMELAK